MKRYTIYTDGSCLKNPGGEGGVGAVIYGEGTKKEYSKGFKAPTTNNQMEIMAAIFALDSLSEPSQVVLHSDSTLVVGTMSRNWKRMKNKGLWELLDKASELHSVEWRWVKGHMGNRGNERCDQLARYAATVVRDSNRPGIGAKLPDPDKFVGQLSLGLVGSNPKFPLLLPSAIQQSFSITRSKLI